MASVPEHTARSLLSRDFPKARAPCYRVIVKRRGISLTAESLFFYDLLKRLNNTVPIKKSTIYVFSLMRRYEKFKFPHRD